MAASEGTACAAAPSSSNHPWPVRALRAGLGRRLWKPQPRDPCRGPSGRAAARAEARASLPRPALACEDARARRRVRRDACGLAAGLRARLARRGGTHAQRHAPPAADLLRAAQQATRRAAGGPAVPVGGAR
eukprot:scaffold87304_cov66-Phaeocystis_antarctica.AAC.3